MAIKRIMGKGYKKFRKCLRCNTPIEEALWDDTVYTCPKCGQEHFVDIREDIVILTVKERPDIRRRRITPEQQAARLRLIEKAAGRRT